MTPCPIQIFDDFLVCPNCDGMNLHQISTEVYFRGEDAVRGIKTTAFRFVSEGRVESGVEASTGASQENNPSPRRDGIAIRFECEGCDAEPVLLIKQHKGLTELRWESGKPTL